MPAAEQQPDLAAVEDRCWRMHLSRSDLPYAALQVSRGWGPSVICVQSVGAQANAAHALKHAVSFA